MKYIISLFTGTITKICPECGKKSFIKGHCHSCGYDETW